MASVCVACRDSKVKCERGVGTGDQCARCKRIGLTCTAAPPSQRGKRTSLSQLGARNKLRLSSAADVRDSSTDAVGSSLGLIATFSEAERTAAAKFACLWSGMVIGPGVAVNSRYLAIQKAARARQYNKPDLMIHAMGLCGHFGYSVEDVLSSSQQSVPIPATIEDFPDAMSTMLCASSGYATGRCATGGIVTSVTNASFEAAVITKQALDMLATDSAMGCEDLYAFGRSSYIHAHDLELVNRLLGHLFANEQAETILLVELPELVRVVDRRMNCYVPCSMRGMIKFGGLDQRDCPLTPATEGVTDSHYSESGHARSESVETLTHFGLTLAVLCRGACPLPRHRVRSDRQPFAV